MDLRLKELECNLLVHERIVELCGPLGIVRKNMSGDDIVFTNSRSVFLYSKSSYRTFLNYLHRMNKGLKYGFLVRLNLVGLGYRFLKIDNYLLLKLGYSHYIKVIIPKDLHVFGYKRQLFVVGVVPQEVNNFVKTIRLFRRPDAYKGKGVQYVGEKLILKEGKRK